MREPTLYMVREGISEEGAFRLRQEGSRHEKNWVRMC